MCVAFVSPHFALAAYKDSMPLMSVWQVAYDDLVNHGATMWWDLPPPVSARIDANLTANNDDIISFTWNYGPNRGPVEYHVDVLARRVINQQTGHIRRIRHIVVEVAEIVIAE